MLNRKLYEASVEESIKFQALCQSMGREDLVDIDKKFMEAQHKKYYSKHTRDYYAWIGVNPPVNTTTLKALYDHAVNIMPYRGYEMTPEIHTKNGQRPHLHILLKINANTRKQHIVAKLAKAFKLNPQSVDVSISSSSSLIESWRKYLRGEKTEEKQELVEKDKEYRENNNIPHMYICPSQ